MHPQDEAEIQLVLKERRSVSTRRKAGVITEAIYFIQSFEEEEEEDQPYVANESQQSFESQLDQEIDGRALRGALADAAVPRA